MSKKNICFSIALMVMTSLFSASTLACDESPETATKQKLIKYDQNKKDQKVEKDKLQKIPTQEQIDEFLRELDKKGPNGEDLK